MKDVLSYLNFVYNPKDYMSFKRIINVPRRGIGEANLKKILKKNEMDKTDLLETILDIGMSNSGGFNAFIKKYLIEMGNICLMAKKMMDDKVGIHPSSAETTECWARDFHYFSGERSENHQMHTDGDQIL